MNILFVLLALIVLVLVVGRIYAARWPEGLRAEVRFDRDRAVEGDTVDLCQIIEYTGRLPLPWVRVKFQVSRDIIVPDAAETSVTDKYSREDVFCVGRMEKVTRRISVECPKRGQHRVYGVDAVSCDPFHFRRFVTSFGGNSGITVYPRRTAIPEIIDAAHQMMGEHIIRRSRMEDPFMFRGVRDYVPGDQLSHINWRVTARTGELAVNQFDHTSDLRVSIWLGFERFPDARDYSICEESIRMAATLLGTFIDEGIPTALCCNGVDCYTGKPFRAGHGCSPEHKDNCLTALARLDGEKEAPPFEDIVSLLPNPTGDSEMVIVVSPHTTVPICQKIAREAGERELLWIVPVRSEEEQRLPGLELIKNSCVWRVVCER